MGSVMESIIGNRICHLKCNPTAITYYGKKLNQNQIRPRVTECPDLSDTPVKVIVVARPLLMPVAQKLCWAANGAFAQ
jgi:hypothetical protein